MDRAGVRLIDMSRLQSSLFARILSRALSIAMKEFTYTSNIISYFKKETSIENAHLVKENSIATKTMLSGISVNYFQINLKLQ